VDDDDFVARRDARAAETRLDGFCRARFDGHFDRRLRPIRSRDADRVEQVPLVLDRVARAESARPRHTPRIHPGAPGDLVPDPLRRTAQPREQRSPWAAMKIDREIVMLAPQAARQPEIGEQAVARRNEHAVQVRIAEDDGGRSGFDDIREMRIWQMLPERANRGGREDDVTNLAKSNEQNVHRAGRDSQSEPCVTVPPSPRR
jgi:hypothetical protein